MINMKMHFRGMDWGVPYTSIMTESNINLAIVPGNSDPSGESNVGLIVGLSVGIAALLASLGFLLYLTRTKWIKYCCCCSSTTKNSNSHRQGDRASQSNDKNSVRGPLNTGPLNAQTLQKDFSSAPKANNSETPRVNKNDSANKMTMTSIFSPPTLTPGPQAPRIPPPHLTNRALDKHPSPSSQLSSITFTNKHLLSTPARSSEPKITVEFSKLRIEKLSCSEASSSQTQIEIKNSGMDTLPFDFNRVERSSGQYVNASRIERTRTVLRVSTLVVESHSVSTRSNLISSSPAERSHAGSTRSNLLLSSPAAGPKL